MSMESLCFLGFSTNFMLLLFWKVYDLDALRCATAFVFLCTALALNEEQVTCFVCTVGMTGRFFTTLVAL